MAHAYNSKEGAAYLIDPLTAPEPSQETGPGSHFGSTMPQASGSAKAPITTAKPVSPASPASSTNPFRKTSDASNNPYRKSSLGSKDGHVRASSREIHHGSPGGSPKPFPQYREAAFGDLNEGRRRSGSGNGPSSPNYNQVAGGESSYHRRRTSSLQERFPGDNSHKPLDVIRRDSKKANRSPHLQRRHIPGADSIDRLDPTMNAVPYHHEGPYDAAMLARNTSFESSPIAAVANSNREALKATPAEKIKDALERHVPIEGVASVPPGEMDRLGRVYNYEEGTDMMRDPDAPGGAYKQWPGVDYARDDIDGKGEPAFSLDKALRAHTIHERDFDGHRGIELSDRPLMSNYDKRDSRERKNLDPRDPVEIAGDDGKYSDLQQASDVEAHASGSNDRHKDVQSHVTRTSSLRRAGEGLKKRLSIKKKFREIHDGEVD